MRRDKNTDNNNCDADIDSDDDVDGGNTDDDLPDEAGGAGDEHGAARVELSV